MPRLIEPQLATLVDSPPTGDQWLNEAKFDGYRMLCRIDHGRVDFFSRNHNSWTAELAHLCDVGRELPVRQAYLDGEVVALRKDGVSDFQILQNVFRRNRVHELIYYAFDILFLDGHDLRALSLEERKEVLSNVIRSSDKTSPFRYASHIIGHGPEVYRQATRLGLEGIICKRRGHPHIPGRGRDWLKVKCLRMEEFVIGGYTDPDGSRLGFGALLLGYYNGADLIYAGRVGTGFDQQLLASLKARMDRMSQRESPFLNLRGKSGKARGANWIKPQLVAQIKFSNWTEDGQLRHPSFLGLRTDKPARELVRDRPVSMTELEN